MLFCFCCSILTDAIKDMHDGLQALNTIVEESKAAGDRAKNYGNDKYKNLQDKLLYAKVYQRRENLRFYGIEEKSGGKEDTHSVLQEFFEQRNCWSFSQKKSKNWIPTGASSGKQNKRRRKAESDNCEASALSR